MWKLWKPIHCGNQFTVTEENVFAQRGKQRNSIADADGNLWLVALICPECGYSIDSNQWKDDVL